MKAAVCTRYGSPEVVVGKSSFSQCKRLPKPRGIYISSELGPLAQNPRLAGPIHLGMDVARDSIAVGILPWGLDRPVVDRIVHDEVPVRRLVARLGNPGRLRACYDAGPTGYGRHRRLTSMGVGCEVVAPALIPRRAGDRVKTGKRDAARLARLHRAGELTPIRVPSAAEEAVRDLCRARADLVDDRRRAPQRLKAFLLRQGRVYRDGSSWTRDHRRWLAAVEAELMPRCAREPFTEAACRLACYRGIR